MSPHWTNHSQLLVWAYWWKRGNCRGIHLFTISYRTSYTWTRQSMTRLRYCTFGVTGPSWLQRTCCSFMSSLRLSCVATKRLRWLHIWKLFLNFGHIGSTVIEVCYSWPNHIAAERTKLGYFFLRTDFDRSKLRPNRDRAFPQNTECRAGLYGAIPSSQAERFRWHDNWRRSRRSKQYGWFD